MRHLIRRPAAPPPAEGARPDAPTVALPTDPNAEEREAQARRRDDEMQEIAWTHLTSGHERFCEDTEAGRSVGAFSESQFVMAWLQTYRELIGDIPVDDGDDGGD